MDADGWQILPETLAPAADATCFDARVRFPLPCQALISRNCNHAQRRVAGPPSEALAPTADVSYFRAQANYPSLVCSSSFLFG